MEGERDLAGPTQDVCFDFNKREGSTEDFEQRSSMAGLYFNKINMDFVLKTD